MSLLYKRAKRKPTIVDIRRNLERINSYFGRNVFERVFIPSLNDASENVFEANSENSQNMNLSGIVFFKYDESIESELLEVLRDLKIRTEPYPNVAIERIIENFNAKIVKKQTEVEVGDRIKTKDGVVGIVDAVREDGSISILVDILGNMVSFDIFANNIEEKLK